MIDDGLRVFDVSALCSIKLLPWVELNGCLLSQSFADVWRPEDPAGSNLSGLFRGSEPEIQREITEERAEGRKLLNEERLKTVA